MVALYVTSLDQNANTGKTTICAGLGKDLLDSGKRVGFFKPLTAEETQGSDSDAMFMKQILGLKEPVDSICPAIIAGDDKVNRIRQAYAKISPGKDIVIVEGMSGRSIIEALDARAIIVIGYSGELSKVKFDDSYKDLGEYLLGIVINKVPRNRLADVRSELSPQFGAAGVNILGVLPEDRILFTLSVGELAEHLHGEILNHTEKSTELVENFMLGAMIVDPGPVYFGRKLNKAVVVRSERPDMQMAALETSLKCLILSGDTAPIPTVRQRAKDENVPIILVNSDTKATVMAIEDTLGKTRLNQEKKLPKLSEVMRKHFNFQAVYKELTLAS